MRCGARHAAKTVLGPFCTTMKQSVNKCCRMGSAVHMAENNAHHTASDLVWDARQPNDQQLLR